MYNKQVESLVENAPEHKPFADYSQYDRLDRDHIAIRIITDLFGIDWITDDHILFKFRSPDKDKKEITTRIDIHGVVDLLLWAVRL